VNASDPSKGKWPRLRWDQFSVPWTPDELIVLWAATPKLDQNYNQSNPAVLEIADLVGRSPSAVDLKMGNLWAVWQPGKGLAHFSRLDQRIVERYRHDLRALERDANRIRGELFLRIPTARAEVRGPDDNSERAAILSSLRDAARDAAGNQLRVHVFERRGSWYIGFFVEAYEVLINPAIVPAYVVIALSIYPRFKSAVARLIERTSDSSRFAREVTRRILPDLEQKHFSRSDLEQIARQLTLHRVDPFHYNRRLSRSFARVDLEDCHQRALQVFHVIPPGDCAKCTIILAAAAQRALENSTGV
jgi:hypothetical protein